MYDPSHGRVLISIPPMHLIYLRIIAHYHITMVSHMGGLMHIDFHYSPSRSDAFSYLGRSQALRVLTVSLQDLCRITVDLLVVRQTSVIFQHGSPLYPMNDKNSFVCSTKSGKDSTQQWDWRDLNTYADRKRVVAVFRSETWTLLGRLTTPKGSYYVMMNISVPQPYVIKVRCQSQRVVMEKRSSINHPPGLSQPTKLLPTKSSGMVEASGTNLNNSIRIFIWSGHCDIRCMIVVSVLIPYRFRLLPTRIDYNIIEPCSDIKYLTTSHMIDPEDSGLVCRLNTSSSSIVSLSCNLHRMYTTYWRSRNENRACSLFIKNILVFNTTNRRKGYCELCDTQHEHPNWRTSRYPYHSTFAEN